MCLNGKHGSAVFTGSNDTDIHLTHGSCCTRKYGRFKQFEARLHRKTINMFLKKSFTTCKYYECCRLVARIENVLTSSPTPSPTPAPTYVPSSQFVPTVEPEPEQSRHPQKLLDGGALGALGALNSPGGRGRGAAAATAAAAALGAQIAQTVQEDKED